ncbi:acyltransferase [Sphingomonas sp. MG17]|uniref:Acyltransferase n=1 Tax=Sphingomonas tagetis TaxID=2949092 RepID=A0A9X2KPI9_9SPHN|nr:acyltransferase family protein [Sphingomonas tagetis]MCP3730768.1 acyltransferase [Sphingomonas tagetis]
MTGTRSTSSTRYLPAIDGLRAVAALSVMLFHIWPRLLPGGYTGVDIFFVISGFVVTRSLAGREFASLGQFAAFFYARRLLRIMPALVAMLLVTLLAAQLFIPDAWLSNSLAQVARFAFFGLSNIVLATDTDSYFGPQATHNPVTHTWSLGVEEQFYLIFPLILWWHMRSHSRARAVRSVAWLSATSLILCAVLSFAAPKFAFYLIVTRFWELGLGMLLCLTQDRWRGWAAQQRWLVPAGLLLIATGFATPEGLPFPFPFALPAVLGTGVLIMAVAAETSPRLLSNPPMAGIGRVSYSLYLWHWPVIVLLRWTTGLHTLPLQLLALALGVTLAVASYLLIEKPLRRHPRFTAQPPARTVGQAAIAVILCTLAGHGLIAAHDRITLSVTGDRHAWYAEPERALPAPARCAVRYAKQRLERGELSSWTPGCPPAFTIFVPADSHGLAYAPNLHRLAAETGAQVRLYFRAGCPYFKLIETHASRPRCAGWYQAVAEDIAGRSRPGDVVFLPGLRLKRIANQFPGDPDAGADLDRVVPAALAEATTILARLGAGGAGIVLEAPKPLFPSPVFRCADSFNRANPICRGLTTSRAQVIERRRHVMAAMQSLAASVPRTLLWDPLPLLCPGATCEALPGGHPLFLDGDHLSGLGNDRVYPDLKRAILSRAAWGRSASPQAARTR